jgi:integrase
MANHQGITVEAALSRLADLLTDRKPPLEPVPNSAAFSITVGLLYKGLERDYVINDRKSVRDLRIRWHKHLAPVFGALPADSLSTQQISAFVNQRLADGAANATINRELAALKRCLRLAVKEGALKLADVPWFPMLRERNTRKGFVTDAAYKALAPATAAVGPWLRTLFELGYVYGFRKGELLSLCVSQVDLAEQTITLNPLETKNDEGRTVAMTHKSYELLSILIAGKAPKDKVFTKGRQNRPIKSFRKAWARATKAAAVPGLLFHDLRRSGIRNMVRAGVTEHIAMGITGHKTRAVFDRYNISSYEDMRQAVVLMEAAALERSHAKPSKAFQPQLQLPCDDAAAVPRKPAGSDRPDDSAALQN